MSYMGKVRPTIALTSSDIADGAIIQRSFGLAEGTYFHNPNTISTSMTTTVPAGKSAAMFGPVTIADGETWTIVGTLSVLGA